MLQPISIEPGQATADTLIRLRQQIDLLELAFSRLASNFESSDYYEDEGFTSPINWIRVNCHMNAGAVADRIAVGDCMDKLPESLQSVSAGDVGFAHLVVMARTAQAVPDFDESELLRDAKKGTPGKFHHHCDHYRHAKDPARFAKEQAELVEHRKLELKAWENGMLSIKGCLDPVGGAVDTVTNTVGGAAGTVTNTVGNTVDTVTGVVDQTSGGATSGASQTVDGTVQTVVDTAGSTTDEIVSKLGL